MFLRFYIFKLVNHIIIWESYKGEKGPILTSGGWTRSRYPAGRKDKPLQGQKYMPCSQQKHSELNIPIAACLVLLKKEAKILPSLLI